MIRASAAADLSAYSQHAVQALWEAEARSRRRGGGGGGGGVCPRDLSEGGGVGPVSEDHWTAWRVGACVSHLEAALKLLASSAPASSSAAAAGCKPSSSAAAAAAAGKARGIQVLVGALLGLLHRVAGAGAGGGDDDARISTAVAPERGGGGGGGLDVDDDRQIQIRIQILEAVRSACYSLAAAAEASSVVRALLTAPSAAPAARRYGGTGCTRCTSSQDGLPDASLLAAEVLREANTVLRAKG
jgi:hypothetical protein